MILRDLHTHTTFCDGENTAEEMVIAAIDKGMKTLGFSGHSYTPFDKGYCMSSEKTQAYRREILRLKEKYQDKIEILCGIEQDFYSDSPDAKYDYVIGSVHYVKVKDGFLSVDDTSEKLISGVNEHFGGDFLLLCEAYFETVAEVAEKTKCDIIGHLDLVAKFNGGGNELFDEKNPRYIKAAESAIKRLLKSGKPFEVNTGAIHRGYRSVPYPAPHLLKLIYENGGKVIMSSDSHIAKTLCYEFPKWQKFCEEIGFKL
ncbi:MAG: histidinol-phosphatase [Oscillospiraceae bacterium]|nr:histidinol-phosphatase [Oscillospiraceae bacterium]